MIKCPGSGSQQMLDWFPDEVYPGAVVCAYCSYGVMVVKNSVREAESESGFEGKAGKVRVHYVDNLDDPYRMSYTNREKS